MTNYTLTAALATVEKHRAATGLHWTDHAALAWLSHGNLSARHLALLVGRSPAATTSIIDRLASRGLIERTTDDIDRRITRLRITPAGRRLMEQADRDAVG